jgi:hypothetical protein
MLYRCYTLEFPLKGRGKYLCTIKLESLPLNLML